MLLTPFVNKLVNSFNADGEDEAEDNDDEDLGDDDEVE